MGRGKARKLLGKILALNNQEIFDVSVWGTSVRLFPGTNICDYKLLMCPNQYNHKELKFLKSHLTRDNANFIDIGANSGAFSLYLAAKSNVKFNIFAFEPNPPMIQRIKQKFFHHLNSELLSKCKFYLFPFALGESEDKLVLISPEGNFGEAYISDEQIQSSSIKKPNSKIEVDVKVLTKVLEEQGVEQIDALKIDIEGYEDKVVKSLFENAASSLLPRALLIEHVSKDLWSYDCITEAKKLGYKVVFETRLNTAMLREQR